jgi:hypothetical protein
MTRMALLIALSISFQVIGNSRVIVAETQQYHCGYINTKGEVSIPFLYEYVTEFSHGIASFASTCFYDREFATHATAKPGLLGLIDRTGKAIMEPTFVYIGPLSDSRAAVA